MTMATMQQTIPPKVRPRGGDAIITDDATGNRQKTVSLADEGAVKQILVSTVFGLWDIVNNLTRLRPSRPQR